MNAPAKPTPIRYVRDRETDARWVSAEALTQPARVRAEMARLRAAGRTVTTLAGRIYVDWSHETTPNPGQHASPSPRLTEDTQFDRAVRDLETLESSLTATETP